MREIKVQILERLKTLEQSEENILLMPHATKDERVEMTKIDEVCNLIDWLEKLLINIPVNKCTPV